MKLKREIQISAIIGFIIAAAACMAVGIQMGFTLRLYSIITIEFRTILFFQYDNLFHSVAEYSWS